MEDIPNKIVNYLGIIADVNLLQADNKPYTEINVSPSGVPISYKGAYRYRSGSTKQELKGSVLQQFILKRLGRTWDDLPCENATFSDIDPDALSYFFKKAANSKRLTTDIEKTDFQRASKVRSIKCLMVHVFGKMAAAFINLIF